MPNNVPLKLTADTLPSLSGRITCPDYDRSTLRPRIAHVGVGGFHRAHLAVYNDDLLRMEKSNWAIHGIGLTEGDRRMAETMDEQNGLYTLISRSAEEEKARIIGSITGFHFSPRGARELCERIAAEDYRIVSLTVTEKGYLLKGDNRDLDLDDPAVVHDLQEPENPKSVVGFLFRIAQKRVAAGTALPTFLSCDNIPHNGSVLRKIVLQYGRLVDPETADVLEHSGCFPNSMVDRITPGTTDSLRDYVQEKWGIEDSWPVVCEDFIQWVVEDRFCNGRPAWEAAGAVFVDDVTPYERMKIRLLNGSHSALAYISYLLGHRDVDRAMHDADVRSFVQNYMAEIEPSVGEIPGIDLKDYQRILVERFSNPAIRDQVLRLAEDGSAKLPNMVLEPVSELLSAGNSCSFAAFAVAAWIRFLKGADDKGETITVLDPRAEELTAAAKACDTTVRPFLDLPSLFHELIKKSDSFVGEMDKWFQRITAAPREALQALLEEHEAEGKRN